MSPGSAYVLMHHWIGEVDGHAGAWGWVHGGWAGSARPWRRRLGPPGRDPHRVGGQAGGHPRRAGRGVELQDGTILAARAVVSNAHPVTTYLDLVGDEHLADVARDIRRYRTRSGSVKVNLALSDLPHPSAWEGEAPGDPHRGLFAISPSVRYLEDAWDDAKRGRTSEHPYIEAVFPTVFEPDPAPDGNHVALCFTQFGPRAGGRLVGHGARGLRTEGRPGDRLYCPGFEDAVEHVEVLAPPDIEERFGSSAATSSREMTPDQMFSLRPIPGYGDYRTPVDGLYLCGSGPIRRVMAVPARNCATVIRRDARRGRLRLRGEIAGVVSNVRP